MRAKRLTTLAETVAAGQGRGLVALVLCPILLAGCAGAGLQSSGLAGPSWEQREALYQQEGEEEGDLGDRLREAEEEGERKTGRRGTRRGFARFLLTMGIVAGVILVLEASSEDDEEADLTFDSLPGTGSDANEGPTVRLGTAVQY